MAEILSQSEIDELLKALDTGELNVEEMKATNTEKKVKLHNFKRPSKFAKDHLRTLHMINENYARLLTNFLSGYLRTLTDIELRSVEALSYYEFNNSISNPTILGIVDFSPLEGTILVDIPPNIAFAFIDRILGGEGSVIQQIRGFTEVELAIVERLILQILNLMREPWENVVSIRPRLEKIETNAQFAQIISPNETVALITLATKIGEAEGLINICIPYMVVEPIVSKLNTRFWFTATEREIEKPQEKNDLIKKRIESAKIPLSVILGRTNITVNEFLELQAGDVIPLDTNANGDLEIMVGDLLKFYGTPGVKKNKVAIKVTQVIKGEED